VSAGAGPRMQGTVYLVSAGHVDVPTGKFMAEKSTRVEAVELAKELRERGLQVTITGPDGVTVDETGEK
jgi:hypothetical protein